MNRCIPNQKDFAPAVSFKYSNSEKGIPFTDQRTK